MNSSIILILCCFTYFAWANPIKDAHQSKPDSRDKLKNCLSDWQKQFVNECTTKVENQIAIIKAMKNEDGDDSDDNSDENGSSSDSEDDDSNDDDSSEEKKIEMFMVIECFLTMTGAFDNKTHQINELKLQHAVVDMSLLSAADQIKADASLKSCMSTPSMTNTNKLSALERAMFCSHDALLKNGCTTSQPAPAL